jgi:hypothetical protein
MSIEKAFENVKVSNKHKTPAQVLAPIDNQMASRKQAVMGTGKAFESGKVSNEHETPAQVLALIDNQMASSEQAVD